MSRAVIVATGNLDHLPAEISSVANELSNAGWQVRLCLGDEATRAGLLQAAGEGDCRLAWFGLHSGAAGFELSDGVWPASQMGVWLRNINARDVVLNSCYSIEHVDAIQRAADVDAAAAIDPAGVDDALAWQVGVYLVRSYIIAGDLRTAVRQASGFGAIQYRFVPCGGVRVEGGRRMPADEIRDQLALLLRAIRGEPENGYVGLVARVNEMQAQLRTLVDEQRSSREDLEREITLIKQQMQQQMQQMQQPVAMSSRQATVTAAAVTVLAILLLFVILRLGGGI